MSESNAPDDENSICLLYPEGELQSAVTADLEKFSSFMQCMSGSGINSFEKAILSTYLVWKSRGSPEDNDG